MSSQLPNLWHLRKVAESSARPCDICYKPTTSVLITPDQRDHFYLCPGHLKDRGFCSPIVDEAVAAKKKRDEEIAREIEIIKKEYEEKLKKKKKSNEDKEKGEKSNKEKDGEKNDEDDDKKAEKEKDDKINALTDKESTSTPNESPRIFTLQKIFYQKRLDRIRNAEIAKRNRERLKSPTLFPSVPTGNP